MLSNVTMMIFKNHFNFSWNVFFFILLLFFGLPLLMCRNADHYYRHSGYQYFTNFTVETEGLQPQNWAILQDQRGLIYVANHRGVAQYDGVSWRVFDVPNRTVRSLAVDEGGTVYVGGENEIGLLTADSKGTLAYVSLLDHIDEGQRNFGSVWKAHSAGEMIYFRTSKYLFSWNSLSKKMAAWEARKRFTGSFTAGDQFFIQQENLGLMQVVKGSLRLVPGTEDLAEKRIYMMASFDDQRVLMGCRSHGFYLYDGAATVPFPTEVDGYLEEKQLYHGIGLSQTPGDFALATLQGGLLVIDKKGRRKHIFDKAWGLQDEDVKYVFEDSSGNLWLALNNGISRIEYASPISLYDQRSGLPGLVLSVVRHGRGPASQLYVGTTDGLYSFGAGNKFRPVPGVANYCWSLLCLNDFVIAATSSGVFQVKNGVGRKVNDLPAFVLHRSAREANRIWVGELRGLVWLHAPPKNGRHRGRWAVERVIKGINQGIRSMAEGPAGSLWLGTSAEGVLRVDFPGGLVTRYNTDHGLPRGEANVFRAAGHIMVGTDRGLFRFSREKNGFIPDSTLGEVFADGTRNVFRLAEDRHKNIWFHSRRRNFQAVPWPDGTYLINRQPFLRLPKVQVNAIYPDPGGDIVWFATHNGLIRYDTTVKKSYRPDFFALIRRVLINGSLVFDGCRRSAPLSPVIDYRQRNIRFAFAAPFFEAETQTRYHVYLEGYDEEWSPWSGETRKDYTNLDAGSYRFRLQAQNVYGSMSREDVFPFRVLPPWYRTWWAYLVYASLLFLGVYVVVRWRSSKLVREKQRLEQIVDDRTREIKEKNRQLEEQSGKLKEMDRVKSRFFANISHEFRTPLTLIMGPLEQLLSGSGDTYLRERVNLALRNSRRLLSLINQLLDLAKLDSGKLQLRASRQDIIPFLKGLVGSFESLVQQKKLALSFHSPEEEMFLYFDPEKLERVVGNLVANALKFTPAGGKVAVRAKRVSSPSGGFLQGFVEIGVSDTGVGIPENQLPHIFDRFYQAGGTVPPEGRHQQGGSGIGLALVKELVSLHRGKIEVQSRQGEGTAFFIRLPLGAGHLKPEETVGETEHIPAQAHDYMEREPMEEDVEPDPADAEEACGKGEDMEKDVILVVEDNADVRQYIREPLQRDYTVVEAADGREGIDKACQIIPDLIISDVMMPEVDGFQLCDVLKKDVKTSHIPIILLTARASEESVIAGLKTGADDYITKPFNTKIMATRIKNLIDLRRLLQERIQREMMLQPEEIAVSSLDREFMKELKAAIEGNMSEPEFNIERLARAMTMGQATLNRKIRALTGESTNQFIQSYRLKRAAQLLKANFGNVTEVAFEVGFSSSSYFTRCFKEKFHQLPHAFQAAESGGAQTPVNP
jgi:signal transduction histidine kinase/DNA-binding response OmpR family regulator/ligand-binding sensor domain-containing protein